MGFDLARARAEFNACKKPHQYENWAIDWGLKLLDVADPPEKPIDDPDVAEDAGGLDLEKH